MAYRLMHKLMNKVSVFVFCVPFPGFGHYQNACPNIMKMQDVTILSFLDRESFPGEDVVSLGML